MGLDLPWNGSHRYEKGRVLYRRSLDQLEAEMMSFSREWDRAVDGSPNLITQIPIA
jgi:hypothetical protein